MVELSVFSFPAVKRGVLPLFVLGNINFVLLFFGISH